MMLLKTENERESRYQVHRYGDRGICIKKFKFTVFHQRTPNNMLNTVTTN